MSILRWRSLWPRLRPFFVYRNVLIAILSITIIMISIVVAGCTTDNLAETYLLSLSYVKSTASATVATHPEQVNANVSVIFSNITNHSSLEVRAGYLGVCIRQNSDQWQCSGSASVLATITQLSSGSMGDPLDLIWIASNFRDQVVFVGLIIIATVFSFLAILLLSSFPGWRTEGGESDSDSEREVLPFPSKSKSYFAATLIAFGSMLLFVSVLWQHIAGATAASMVSSLSYGTIEGKVGPAAIALGWTAVLLYFVAFAGIIISIQVSRVSDDVVNRTVSPNRRR